MLLTGLRWLAFLRAGWRRLRGRCPRCGRKLDAKFAYYMTDDPDCPVCEDSTQTAAGVWRTYRTAGSAAKPVGTGLKQ